MTGGALLELSFIRKWELARIRTTGLIKLSAHTQCKIECCRHAQELGVFDINSCQFGERAAAVDNYLRQSVKYVDVSMCKCLCTCMCVWSTRACMLCTHAHMLKIRTFNYEFCSATVLCVYAPRSIVKQIEVVMTAIQTFRNVLLHDTTCE